jgi:hypothetical protein
MTFNNHHKNVEKQMPTNRDEYKYFDNFLLDAITNESESNYFSPVVKEIIKSEIKITNLLDVGCGTVCLLVFSSQILKVN